MPHPIRIQPALCLIAALAAAAPAPAQLAATPVTPLGGTDFFADTEFTLPLMSGGALACYETSATAFGGGSVTLVRVDEEGTELWRRADAVASRTGRMDSLQRTPGGSFLLCTQDSTSSSFRDGRLLSIDPSGALEWETWPASATSGPFLGRVAGFSPSGDIYLIGYTRGEDVLSALLIDAATGAELWRIDRPGVADFQFVDSFRGSSAGGDLFVSGAYVGSDTAPGQPADAPGPAFLRETLGVRWRTDHAATTGGLVAPNGRLLPKRTRLDFVADHDPADLRPPIYAVEAPDALEPADSLGTTVLRYNESTMSAGVAHRGPSCAAVTLGVPFETLATPTERATLMRAVLRFFEE